MPFTVFTGIIAIIDIREIKLTKVVGQLPTETPDYHVIAFDIANRTSVLSRRHLSSNQRPGGLVRQDSVFAGTPADRRN